MAYIGQEIKGGTFKVLDTSGNTYNGSNVTFSLGTQVGAAAQLLVSHDGVIQKPGTDYTLASGGASITFSTAPASGASIFIVEISGAVGGTITPADNSVGVTQLNLSDGSSGQFIKTDGSGTLSFASVASLAGIDDQSSSNDDQLTITDTAVVINEDSDDVDFRVESNGNANMLHVNAGDDRVGIGADPDQGKLHVKSSDTSATAGTDSDELVLENNSAGGLTILSGTAANGKIAFGDSGDADIGAIIYEHDGNNLRFHASGTEVARFNNAGGDDNFFVHCTATPSGGTKGFAVLGQIIVSSSSSTSEQDVMRIEKPSGRVGSIVATNSGTAFNTSSDYRLKENVDYTFDATTRLKQLKPARFNWIVDDTNTLQDGFLAHEVSSIVPEAITGTKDATETKTKVVVSSTGVVMAEGVEQSDWTQGKTDGKYPSNSTWEASKTVGIYQQIDQAKLVPLLVKTVQELEARIATLEG